MIESALNRKLLPSWFLSVGCKPTYTVDNLFRLVKSSIYKIIFPICTRRMVFSSFYIESRGLNGSPIVFCCWICWTVWIEASIFEFLLILGYSSEKNEVFLKSGQSMTIPRQRIICWIRFHLRPFSFNVFVKVRFDSINKWTWTWNTSIDINSLLYFAVSDVITWAVGRIVHVSGHYFCDYFVFIESVIPVSYTSYRLSIVDS